MKKLQETPHSLIDSINLFINMYKIGEKGAKNLGE